MTTTTTTTRYSPAWRAAVDAGLDPARLIPLLPGTKAIHARAWGTRDAADLWRTHGGARCNVGARAGAGLAIVDLDDHDGTNAAGVEAGLAALRVLTGRAVLPVVKTPTNAGRQVYLRVNTADLVALVGNGNAVDHAHGGELRYGQGSQSATVGSTVGTWTYTVEAGDLHDLPHVEARALLAALGVDLAPATTTTRRTAAALAYTGPAFADGRGVDWQAFEARLDPDALALLRGDPLALASYTTAAGVVDRSRADAAAMYRVLLCGIAPDLAAAALRHYGGAGKVGTRHDLYAERMAAAVAEWVKDGGGAGRTTRAKARVLELARGALLSAWPGRSGAGDLAVLLAACFQSWRAGGRREFDLSARDAALLSGCGRSAAARALGRLTRAGYLVRRVRGGSDKASGYKFGRRAAALAEVAELAAEAALMKAEAGNTSVSGTHELQSGGAGRQALCNSCVPLRVQYSGPAAVTRSSVPASLAGHDLFTRAGLGPRAALVYWRMVEAGGEVRTGEAAEAVGLSSRAAGKVLAALALAGLVVLSVRARGYWLAVPDADLDGIAAELLRRRTVLRVVEAEDGTTTTRRAVVTEVVEASGTVVRRRRGYFEERYLNAVRIEAAKAGGAAVPAGAAAAVTVEAAHDRAAEAERSDKGAELRAVLSSPPASRPSHDPDDYADATEFMWAMVEARRAAVKLGRSSEA